MSASDLYAKSDLSLLRFKRIMNEIENKKRVNIDYKDYSYNPSFSKFEVPYNLKCRERYKQKKRMYEAQFQREIEQLLMRQASAYEEARLNRHLCITTLWPPMHNRAEIQRTQRYFFPLTRKERTRLNFIMCTNII